MRGLARFTSCCLVAGLFGCTNPAPVPQHIHIEDIIHNIRCELYETVWGGWSNELTTGAHPWLSKWNAAVTLRLQVDRNAGIAGAATYTVPVQVGIFTIGFAGGIDKAANNATSIDYTVRLEDLASKVYENCAHLGTAYYSERPPKLLAGNLGLRDWIDRSALALEQTAEETQTTGLTYVVDFVISAAAELTPSILANRLTKPYSASLTVAGARKDTHRMTVVFSKPGKADKTHADIIEAINQLSAKIDADEGAYNFNVARIARADRNISGIRNILGVTSRVPSLSAVLNLRAAEFKSNEKRFTGENGKDFLGKSVKDISENIEEIIKIGKELEKLYNKTGIQKSGYAIKLLQDIENLRSGTKSFLTGDISAFLGEGFTDEVSLVAASGLNLVTLANDDIADLTKRENGQLSLANEAQRRLSQISLQIARDRSKVADLRTSLPPETGLDRTEFLQLREALSSSIILP